jgi:CubicO group peptidase (beta-lactamase class C family)
MYSPLRYDLKTLNKEMVMRRMNRISLVISLIAVAAFSLMGASLPSTKPDDVGLSSERLQRIHAMVLHHMDLGEITGAVVLVARKGQVAYVDVQGTMDAETKKPMTCDSLFRMASMTKPVIGTAVMMMLEEGRIQLGDPISKYIPEFKDMKVGILQSPGSRGAGNPPKFYTVPAERPITIKDILTHTSGLSSGPMGQSEAAKVRRQPTETLADYIPRLGATPLEFQPGTRWMYSPSDGFDVLARIVEIASGIPLNVFLKQRIFDPLEMPETSHYPTDAQMPRLVTAYQKTDKGLVKTQNSLSMSSKVYFAGGGGLISTVDDYSHFAQMLANGGELYGRRLLSPRTVKLMSSVHIPWTLPGRTTGEGFGLSVRVMQDAIVGNHRVSDGSFGWSGAYGTHFWVDPKEQLVAVMMIQTPIREMRPEFENAVMQSIVK